MLILKIPFADGFATMKPKTIIHALDTHQQKMPEKIALAYLNSNVGIDEQCNYGMLWKRITQVAFILSEAGIQSGECALLIYEPGLEYVYALLGCFYAGVIAVPVYPPASKPLVDKLRGILETMKPRVILSKESTCKQFKKLNILKFMHAIPPFKSILSYAYPQAIALVNWDFQTYTWVSTDRIVSDIPCMPHQATSDAIAYLQYTSGSTGHPKGVMVTHHNLMMNIAMCQQFQEQEDIVGFMWLPLYHDMGLIGGLLHSLCEGRTHYFASPMTFIKNPLFWLQGISNYRVNFSAAPNFAYAMCVQRIQAHEMRDLDLSCWTMAINAAEPIQHHVIKQFYEKFAPCGLQMNALIPAYGLAEATLLVSGHPIATMPNMLFVDRHAFTKKQVLIGVESPTTFGLVSCGRPCHPIKLVDSETNACCKDDEIGEIWVSGPHVTQGYWNEPDLTQAVFKARLSDDENEEGITYLKTGDLGFMHEGELYICGRKKDLIIINGLNHYPQDIEQAVAESDPLIRQGGVVAFSIQGDETEHLVVMFSTIREVNASEIKAIFQQVVHALSERGLTIGQLLWVNKNAILKTTSGKLRRSACKAALLENRLVIREGFQPTTFSEDSMQQMDDAALVEKKLQQIIHEVLSIDRDALKPDQSLFDFHVTSVQTVEMLLGLQKAFDCDFPPSFVHDYASLEKMKGYILRAAQE